MDAVGLEPLADALVVVLQEQGLAIGDADRLEDAVREQESAILEGHSGGIRKQLAVVEDVGHALQS